MIYCIARPEGHTTGGAFWKDLRTIRGYINRANKAVRNLVHVGQYLAVEIYRSEHPDHPYGNDTLIGKARILRTS